MSKSGADPETVANECRKLGIRSIFTDEVIKGRCRRHYDEPCSEPCINFTDCFLTRNVAEATEIEAISSIENWVVTHSVVLGASGKKRWMKCRGLA